MVAVLLLSIVPSSSPAPSPSSRSPWVWEHRDELSLSYVCFLLASRYADGDPPGGELARQTISIWLGYVSQHRVGVDGTPRVVGGPKRRKTNDKPTKGQTGKRTKRQKDNACTEYSEEETGYVFTVEGRRVEERWKKRHGDGEQSSVGSRGLPEQGGRS